MMRMAQDSLGAAENRLDTGDLLNVQCCFVSYKGITAIQDDSRHGFGSSEVYLVATSCRRSRRAHVPLPKHHHSETASQRCQGTVSLPAKSVGLSARQRLPKPLTSRGAG